MQSTRDGMRRIVVGQGCSLQVSRDGGENVRMLTESHIKPPAAKHTIRSIGKAVFGCQLKGCMYIECTAK